MQHDTDLGKRVGRTFSSLYLDIGGGNHFVEVCLDKDQFVWIMLHSGSRGIGNEIAQVHIDIAKGLFGESLKDLADPDLAYLKVYLLG